MIRTISVLILTSKADSISLYDGNGAEIKREVKLLNKETGATFSEYKADAVSGIDLVDKISKFTLVENLNVGGYGAGGTVRGSIKGGDAEVLIASKFYYNPPYKGTDPVKMWTNWYIGTAIHEIMHLAGRSAFSDGALAKAAFDIGESKNPVSDPYTNDITKIYKYSGNWQDALAKHCGRR